MEQRCTRKMSGSVPPGHLRQCQSDGSWLGRLTTAIPELVPPHLLNANVSADCQENDEHEQPALALHIVSRVVRNNATDGERRNLSCGEPMQHTLSLLIAHIRFFPYSTLTPW